MSPKNNNNVITDLNITSEIGIVNLGKIKINITNIAQIINNLLFIY
jgi:hypothetical protein